MEAIFLFTGFPITIKKRLRNISMATVGIWALAAVVIGLYSGFIILKIVKKPSKMPFHDDDVSLAMQCV